MADVRQGSFLRDDTTGALVVVGPSGSAVGSAYDSGHPLLRPAGVLAESFPRSDEGGDSPSVLTSGTVYGALTVAPRGRSLTGAAFASADIAAVTPTNQWAALIRQSDRKVVAVSPDATNAAWAANTVKAFTFGTPYVPTADELVYLAIMVAAATPPNLVSGGAGWQGVQNITPLMGVSFDTGKTTPYALNATAAAPTGIARLLYAQLRGT